MKVGYLGPEGTFSEEASKIYARKIKGKVSMQPFATFHDALVSADKKSVDEIIVPIENSIEGTIGTVTDMLARDVNLKICGELIFPVHNYLLAQKGVKANEITDVISHPQPLEQCKDYLRRKLPKAKLHLSYSTSEAAKQVAQSLGEKIISHGVVKGPVFAAIGTLASAKLYGLSVIARDLNSKDNQTRFVILSKQDHKKTGKDKTSIVFTLPKDRPGGLHDVLAEFAERDINLTKIESRPVKKELGDYYFFVDLEGHRDDIDISRALRMIESKVAFYKLLGSYPKARR
ncbi:prephenate dehydratase [Candidatus Saganbacteria bacterium]|nr:prephenate dehydratase [Candidatus Saganbacteria bacterium]